MLFPKPIGNTLPLNLFFPTHSVLFPSVLLCSIDGLFVLQNTLKCMVFHVIRMLFTYANNAQIIWCAELSSSHHAMRYCYHSFSIARSRL